MQIVNNNRFLKEGISSKFSAAIDRGINADFGKCVMKNIHNSNKTHTAQIPTIKKSVMYMYDLNTPCPPWAHTSFETNS